MLGLLVILALGQQPGGPEGPIYSSPSRMGGVVFEAFGAGGAGMPVAADVCAAVQDGDKSGNWFCLRGVGQAAAGGAALTSNGTPQVISREFCPNGPDCSVLPGESYFDGTDDYYNTADTASPSGDISCVAMVMQAELVTDRIVVKDDQATNRSFLFGILDGAHVHAAVCKDNTTCTSISTGGGITTKVWNVVGFSYDFITDGTSTLRGYVNGTQVSSNTTAVGPPPNISRQIRIGVDQTATPFGWLTGRTRGVFCTEKALSDADQLRISDAVWGTLTGSKGEAMTYTRTGSRWCQKDDTVGNFIAANKPCLKSNGYESYAAATNLLFESEKLDDATNWALVSVPVVTANTWNGPDRFGHGETVDDDSAIATEGIEQSRASTTQSKYTCSVYAQSGTTTEMRIRINGVGNTAGDRTCTFTDLTTTTTRKICTTTAAYGSGLTDVKCALLVGDADADTGTIKVGYAQLEAKAYATPYHRTTTAGATRSSERLSFAKPTGLTDAAGCASATFVGVDISGTTPRIIGFNSQTPVHINGSNTSLGIFDGTAVVAVTVANMNGRAVNAVGSWFGSTQKICEGATCNSGAYDGTITSATIDIGSEVGGAHWPDTVISKVKFGRSTGACQ